MNLLNKLFLQKITLICTVLLLSACGGDVFDSDTTRDALPATAALQKLADNAVASPINMSFTGRTTKNILDPAGTNPFILGNANLYIGTLDVPYYFDTSMSLSSYWLPSLPVQEVLTIPVMMTLPNTGITPTDGWPIVIFQHGITRSRTDVIAYAQGLAQAGFAVIAIDLPTHGLTPANPLNAFFNAETGALSTALMLNATEQTYGVDVRRVPPADPTDPTAFDPDGIVDSSGTHFVNLSSLLTSRDNVRQGTANLLTLRKSLANIPDIDESKVGLIAHSLGGMVAVPYLGVETTLTPSSLVTTGATITEVLQNSGTFSGVIKAGLEKLGVISEEDINAFYDNAQEIVDAGEPANYAAMASAKHPIHLIEVIGDNVVPNSATENLADLMGAIDVSATTVNIQPGTPGIVRFTKGEHGSVASPDNSATEVSDFDFLDVTTEMQTQLATFQATAHGLLPAPNPNVPTIVVSTAACNIVKDAMCPEM